ncbi:MAG: phosphoribosylanthranilate isomerase [Fuerstiella sp.]
MSLSIYTKVCGLTQQENTRMVVAAGADAIGLNFYPKSKRFVSLETAVELRKQIPEHVDVVGVFVNRCAEEVIDIAQAVSLTAIQFHGDESVAQMKHVYDCRPSTKIYRAFRLGHENLKQTIAEVAALEEAGVPLSAVLVDAFVAGEFGGTGHQLDHKLIQQLPIDWPPLIVAGGLTADNVADCINAVNPWGVDVASGVESEPGVKTRGKTEQFIRAAKAAKH